MWMDNIQDSHTDWGYNSVKCTYANVRAGVWTRIGVILMWDLKFWKNSLQNIYSNNVVLAVKGISHPIVNQPHGKKKS